MVDTARYLVVTLVSRLTWSPHIDQVRRRTAKRMGVLGPLLNSKSLTTEGKSRKSLSQGIRKALG